MDGGWGDNNNWYMNYFDKGGAFFRGMLFIATINDSSGEEIWMIPHLVQLPNLLRQAD